MKKKMFLRLVAMLLVVSMLPVSAGAVTINGLSSTRSSSGRGWLESFIYALWDSIRGKTDTEEEETDQTTSELEVVTDETTVQNADMLRASTYNLTNTSLAAGAGDTVTTDTSTVLKYFPVTLYDYDTDTINNATHQKEIDNGTMTTDSTQWQGIYFMRNRSVGRYNDTSYTTSEAISNLTWSQVQSGTYYADEACTTAVTVGTTEATQEYIYVSDVTLDELLPSDINSQSYKACSGFYYYYNGSYRQLYVRTANSSKYKYRWAYYSTLLSSYNQIATSDGVPNITIYKLTETTSGYSMTVNGETYTTEDLTATVPVTLYSKIATYGQEGTTYSGTTAYAAWNWWDKGGSYGQCIWSGLVADKLDSLGNIVFTKDEGGIFNSDTTVKDIYTNVEMPFVYDSTKKTYTFDSDADSVYFHADTTQNSTGTPASNSRLYWNDTPQSNSGSYGDGSKNVWAPFDDATSFVEQTRPMSYHFGMQAVVPFTMTSNGRLVANKDDSDAITFDFAGDDDVWVFIDGQLVVDLGGIHNRLAVQINFAENTVTYSVPSSNTSTAAIGNANEDDTSGKWAVTDSKITQQLFNETAGDGTGLINQTRVSFAAKSEHQLTIYYLERGEGSSNCKIQFNLPMQDTVTVTKQVDEAVKVDENGDYVNDEDGNVITCALTADQKAAVNNINFGFTLYYKYEEPDGSTAYGVAENMTYYLLDSTGTAIDARSTDANGHFTLKNGQSAKFSGDMGTVASYYVVEDDLTAKGFTKPQYTYSGEATGTSEQEPFKVGTTADEFVSYKKGDLIPASTGFTSSTVTVYGSSEAVDSLKFTCENYVAYSEDIYVKTNDVKVVLDYGLGVEINALKNDLASADTTLELLAVYGNCTQTDTDGKLQTQLSIAADGTVTAPETATVGKGAFGTATINTDKNTVTYNLTEQLTDVEILNYVVKASRTVELTGDLETAYGIGTIYIIPATVMYYEENFSDLVTYTGSWEAVTDSTYTDTLQEPGVVGTTDDSPYGSDAAYQKDSRDSNGTSMYVDTTNGAASFSYTFTGTGTSFFARTSNNTGYMKVTVTKQGDSTFKQVLLRDTCYEDSSSDVQGTLYNIPVYTTDNLTYGTYTVTVVIAKKTTIKGTVTMHPDFWLDGIRVFGPMDTATDTSDDSYTALKKQEATAAYATDGESNMLNITLREKLLKVKTEAGASWEKNGFVVFTDTDGAIKTAETYESIGPKEELYLYNGQKITFTLQSWDRDNYRLFLGIKAPTGSATAKINGKPVTLENAADCYLDLKNYMEVQEGTDGKYYAIINIEAGEGALVSVTNIKVTGTVDFVLVNETNKDVKA